MPVIIRPYIVVMIETKFVVPWSTLCSTSKYSLVFCFSFKMWWASYSLHLSCLCLLSIQAREKKRVRRRRRKSDAYFGTAWFILYWKLQHKIRKNVHIFVRSAWITICKYLRSSKTTGGKSISSFHTWSSI